MIFRLKKPKAEQLSLADVAKAAGRKRLSFLQSVAQSHRLEVHRLCRAYASGRRAQPTA
jgi:hypothetical protein